MNKTNKKFTKKFQKKKHNEYYATNNNFDYYNVKKKFQNENEIFVNFITTKKLLSRCQRCRKSF